MRDESAQTTRAISLIQPTGVMIEQTTGLPTGGEPRTVTLVPLDEKSSVEVR